MGPVVSGLVPAVCFLLASNAAHAAPNAITQQGRLFDAEGTARARTLRCGDELWFVHDTPAPHRVYATPSACADRLRAR